MENIKILIEKFWNEGISEQEEVILHEAYINGKVTDRDLCDYFEYGNLEADIKMNKAIDFSVLDNPKAKVIPLFTMRKIAAAVALLVGVFFLFKTGGNNNPDQPIAIEESFEEPEEALATLKMALAFTSNKFNNGHAKLNLGLITVEKLNIVQIN